MNEVKIQIPDNCELIKDGDTYVVREKKQVPPRSWEEFCKKYPIQKGETYISPSSDIHTFKGDAFRDAELDKCICTSKEEAEAFLALMQLRQLRKAWVGDWKPSGGIYYAIVYVIEGRLKVDFYERLNKSLSFPTKGMAEDFLNCFRDLCETTKIFL